MPTRDEINKAINKILKQFNIDINNLTTELYNKVIKLVDLGVSVDKAYTIALNEIDYIKRTTDLIVNSSIKTMGAHAIVSKEFVLREWWLDKIWTGDDLKISDTVSKNQNIIKREIKKQLRAKNTWIKTAKGIQKSAKIKADLPKYLSNLLDAAKRANMSDDDYKIYSQYLKKAIKNIEKLARFDAPTTRLKKAYNKLVESVIKDVNGNFEKQIAKAVDAKSEYFAQRIARTEMARANATALQLKIDNNKKIIGWKSNLNSRHVITDICDVWAKSDMYGMGQGKYPRALDIQIPYHPHCFCFVTFVYSSDVKRPKFSINKVADYLVEHPSVAKKVMNKTDYELFLDNPKKWSIYLRGWRKPLKIKRPPKEAMAF